MTTPRPQQNNIGLIRQYIAHQETLPYQIVTADLPDPVVTSPLMLSNDTYLSQEIPPIAEQTLSSTQPTKKPRILRVVAIALACILALGMYFIWHFSSPPTTTTTGSITQQHFTIAPTTVPFTSTSAIASPANTGKIQVYIVGAVKNPGVYTLENNARVYQLLQKAGGPLPQANLVVLNLAARLNDGQEIYITSIGETSPVSISSTPSAVTTTGTTGTTGSQININTASASELRLGLHISSTTAQAIITYRLQHSSFTSVEELLQVVSQTIYKKIKDEVKIS